MPCGAGKSFDDRGRGDTGNVFHGPAQCVRARQAHRQRNAARAWRLVGNRHHGYSTRQGVRCSRHRNRWHAGEMRRLPQARRRSAVNYNTEDFVALSKQATQGRGAELILDMVSAVIMSAAIMKLPPSSIVQIAFVASSRVTVDLMRLMLKRLIHTGSTLRARRSRIRPLLRLWKKTCCRSL